MKAASNHDISVHVADGVSIKLPRLRFEVERRQAERLRDVLNEVLPTHGTRRYVLALWDGAHPELSEPCSTEQERTETAQDMRRAHGADHDLFRLNVGAEGTATVQPFRGDELEMPKPTKWVSSAWINGRNATVHLNTSGMFEVNAYEKAGEPRLAHVATFEHHGTAFMCGDTWTRTGTWDTKRALNEGVPCPACEAWADGGRVLSPQEWIDARDELCDPYLQAGRGAGMHKPRVPVHVRDRVLDPLDGQWREVTKVTGLAVVFADGCTMGLREAEEAEKRLPSEALPS